MNSLIFATRDETRIFFLKVEVSKLSFQIELQSNLSFQLFGFLLVYIFNLNRLWEYISSLCRLVLCKIVFSIVETNHLMHYLPKILNSNERLICADVY